MRHRWCCYSNGLFELKLDVDMVLHVKFASIVNYCTSQQKNKQINKFAIYAGTRSPNIGNSMYGFKWAWTDSTRLESNRISAIFLRLFEHTHTHSTAIACMLKTILMRTPDFSFAITHQTSWHRFSYSFFMPGGQAKPIKEITIELPTKVYEQWHFFM